MVGFSFEMPSRVFCQIGGRKSIGTLAKELGVSRALIVTDRQIVDAGLTDDILISLKAAGIAHHIFCDVMADPPQAVIFSALNRARDIGADLVIGLGGGSSMDTAKLVALLAASEQTLDEVFGVNLANGQRLPLIQVPTTAGTGSEVTPISIVTTPDHQKKGVVTPLLYADVALLDAELTLGLPASVAAMTGVDAMVHAIEAYTSRIKKNPVSDALARKALQLLTNGLPRVMNNGADVEARESMLQGAMLAGMAFANAPVAAVHALAYPLGGTFHVPHGLSNALVLSPVLEFNLPSASTLYAELASAVMPGRTATGLDFGNYMSELVRMLPIAQSLSEVGVSSEDLRALAEDSMKIDRLLVNNPREVMFEDALRIYQSVL